MEYAHRDIEKRWQEYWKQANIYKVETDPSKPKYYVLDMFPYPSGAGLHVGHPLGYIASDIYSRYMRLKGYNVLHPMGYDAFGLPAEQYALQTGRHPKDTTNENVLRYRQQLEKIGFSYDWSREFRTSDPDYYEWTQWAFLKMYAHYYNTQSQKAEPIENLIAEFEKHGNLHVHAACGDVISFDAAQWKTYSEFEKQEILFAYRLAFMADTVVNWCPALGTVLANDEVKDGLSVRGGHPVEQRKMKQWLLRITAYAQRYLDGMENLDWSDSIKELQKNWIGKSEGAQVFFDMKDSDLKIEVFTTRPDTIFGATFMVLAPESQLVQQITTAEHKAKVQDYIDATKKRSERDRIADVKRVSGEFTGAYAINPFTNLPIPVWISDYVLAGYGTGAIMAVPAHDSRDYAFARFFNLPIVQVVEGGSIEEASYDAKEGKMMNSQILNGLEVKEAIQKILAEIENRKLGKRKVNFRLRDAIFSRQRYWGEPFPVYYKDNLVYPLTEDKLPLQLPDIQDFQPTAEGLPPLARAQDWKTNDGHRYEYSTMPGFAGSSAYFFRFMDPRNNKGLVSEEAVNYWRDVDLYIGGIEHATGHLIYSRFWTKFLFDLGIVPVEEPFRKLVNQGMIQGRSNFVYRLKTENTFVSAGLRDQYETTELHVDVNIVKNDVLDVEAFRKWRPELADARFILEDDKYICGFGVEKMSKSMYNVVTPDDIIDEYGADTLRLYEMFLGPLEQSKPWDTSGIEGVNRFLKKYWRLFFNKNGELNISDEKASADELKILHKTIKKAGEDITRFSFNTAVSAFMVCVNELSALSCNKREILDPLTRTLCAFAPHIAEELWHILGHTDSVVTAQFPAYNEEYLKENAVIYPVAFNGKRRFEIQVPIELNEAQVKEIVTAHSLFEKWMEGKQMAKFIFVQGKMVNVVLK